MLMVVVFVISLKNNYGGADAKFQFRPLLCALWDGKWAVFAPIIILGGIYAGIFTPSEAAAVGRGLKKEEQRRKKPKALE